MTPIDQTTFGVGQGNCFSACVASLLGIPIDEVPYFMGHTPWFDAFLAWLRPRGFYAFSMPYDAAAWAPEGFYILGGISPRGPHAVVARGHEIVHDPNPCRAGLLRREECTVVVPFDLAAARASTP